MGNMCQAFLKKGDKEKAKALVSQLLNSIKAQPDRKPYKYINTIAIMIFAQVLIQEGDKRVAV